MREPDLEELCARARDGDDAAWAAIVDRFVNLVWSVARSFRFDEPTAADVVQTTWLRLAERIGTIRDPNKLAGWLATTARNECLGLLRRSGRELPTDFDRGVPADGADPLDANLLANERDRALWTAFRTLTEKCQALLRLLFADPPMTYEEVGEVLGLPHGTIGPSRTRCIDQLRTRLQGADLS